MTMNITLNQTRILTTTIQGSQKIVCLSFVLLARVTMSWQSCHLFSEQVASYTALFA